MGSSCGCASPRAGKPAGLGLERAVVAFQAPSQQGTGAKAGVHLKQVRNVLPLHIKH